MNSKLQVNVGDIVRIKGKRGLRLVVRSEARVDLDRARNESYHVDEFDTIAFDGQGVRGSIVQPKVSNFYFKEGSMRGKGQEVQASDVSIAGQALVKTVVRVEYVYNSAKIN